MTKEQLLQIVSFIDLTTLNSTDTDKTIVQLVEKANKGLEGINPAAICVFPNFADHAFHHTDIKIAVVAGCFPTGQTFLDHKVEEVRFAADTHASEIDIVINRGKVIEGDYEYFEQEMSMLRDAAEDKVLKVILESGELNADQIKESARLAIENGADFIKTSTGKSSVGATPEAAKIICDEIKTWHHLTDKKVGFKVSGGVKFKNDALVYMNIVKDILGEEWLTPELFRIGASSLYDNIASDLANL